MSDVKDGVPDGVKSDPKTSEEVKAAKKAAAAALKAEKAADGEPKASASIRDFHVKFPSAPKGECNCALYTQYREGKEGKERDSIEVTLVDGVASSVKTLNGAPAPDEYCPSVEDLLAAGFVRF